MASRRLHAVASFIVVDLFVAVDFSVVQADFKLREPAPFRCLKERKDIEVRVVGMRGQNMRGSKLKLGFSFSCLNFQSDWF